MFPAASTATLDGRSRRDRLEIASSRRCGESLRAAVLFARAGEPHCPRCGRVVERQSAQTIARSLLDLDAGTTITLLAPIVSARKGEHREVLEDAVKQMRGLIEEQRFSTDLAASTMTSHWEGQLLEWFNADRNLRLDPPELPES